MKKNVIEEQAIPKRNQSIDHITIEKPVKMKITCKPSCALSMSWVEITSDGIVQHNEILRES